jgi:hypothetical protein
MIVLENHAPAAPLDVTTLIRRQKLSASDRTALRSTCERIARSLDQIEANRPSKTGFYSRLQAAADAAPLGDCGASARRCGEEGHAAEGAPAQRPVWAVPVLRCPYPSIFPMSSMFLNVKKKEVIAKQAH